MRLSRSRFKATFAITALATLGLAGCAAPSAPAAPEQPATQQSKATSATDAADDTGTAGAVDDADDADTTDAVDAADAFAERVALEEEARRKAEVAAKEAVPAAEDANGRWCPTPESAGSLGCVVIALPQITYEDSGSVYEIKAFQDDLGQFNYTVPGAPLGVLLPAGVPLEIPDYFAGSDAPDEARIWSSQSATLYLRA